jgi:outer membrane protein insertion porin family
MEGVFEMTRETHFSFLPGSNRGIFFRARRACVLQPGVDQRPTRTRVPRPRGIFAARWLALFLCAFSLFGPDLEAKEKPAKMEVSGFGIFGDLDLKRTLRILTAGKKTPEFFDGNYVEDCVVILFSSLEKQGYLKPTVHATMTLADGSTMERSWEGSLGDESLPRDLHIRKVRFEIREGPLFRYREITIQRLTVLPLKRGEEFFVEGGVLIPLKKTRVFTPANLNHSMAALTETLQRRGYENASVKAARISRDDSTGIVDVVIDVVEGPRWMVNQVREEFIYPSNQPPVTVEIETNRPYSKLWTQNLEQALKRTNYAKGYPDTAVTFTPRYVATNAGQINLDLEALVNSGPQVHVRDIRFEGVQRTRPGVLRRRVDLESGDLLDRVEAEHGRTRLSRLGIFQSVGLRYDQVDATNRDIVYELKEAKRIDVSLLFGYGSYELLRGGVEIEQYNVFGFAHTSKLRAVQSFKASSVDYRYTVPEVFGEEFDGFLDSSWLQREEPSFTRHEFGGGIGVLKRLPEISTDLGMRYRYEVLDASDADSAFGRTEANVGAFIFELRHDMRDNPLYPHSGYKVFSTIELASDYFASDVNYQKWEVAASWHQPLDEGRWLHFGISHGLIHALGAAADDLPFNRRFFPGGDNSIRGFQEGEAGPRNAAGKVVGAESYLLGSMEFEQALTRTLAFVGFVDGLGFARDFSGYPFDETLLSAGGGLRWRTIVGPVRLEYGHNINPRAGDPSGTLHFSIGFPF